MDVDGFEIVRFSWFNGAAEPVDVDGVRGIAILQPQAIDVLPGEFFNRELQEIATICSDATGVDLDAALCGFVSEWGFPRSPLLYSPAYIGAANMHERARAAHDTGMGDHLTAILQWDVATGGDGRMDGLSMRSVGVPELVRAITFMADVARVYTIIDAGLDASSAPMDAATVCRTVNECASRGAYMATRNGAAHASAVSMPSLTNAICAQIIEHEQDPSPWRLCACEGCGRWFKRRRGNARYQQGDVDSRYCSAKCNNRQRQRNKRKRERR